MFVKVVLNEKATELDRAFTYRVPCEFEEEVMPGKRVLVSLGRRKCEGVIVSVDEEAPGIKGIKPIIEILDVRPVISSVGFKLAHFIVKKYLCSMNDALRLNMPAGLRTFIDEKIYISKDADPLEYEGIYFEILSLLEKYNGVHQQELCEAFKRKSLRKEIIYLEEQGAVELRAELKSSLSDKTATVVNISVSKSEAEEYILNNGAKKARVRVMKLLAENKSMLLSDIYLLTKANRKTVDALKGEGLLELEEIEVIRKPFLNREYSHDENKPLTSSQLAVFNALKEQIIKNEHKVFLLHGVTGSGKTEVYLQIIGEVIKRGKTAMVLVPEISLTPQIAERFFSRFGDCVALIHSGLSKNERNDQYKLIRSGKIKVVIGARSAVFAPIENTGIIIVDEEHESSYRSDNTPKYDGVEVAIKRAEIENAPILLASATPSVSSYYKATEGEWTLLEMPERYNNSKLPEVYVTDMREELKGGNFSPFGRMLKQELALRIEKGEQSILFLNRRGHSTFVSCRNCGFVAKCPSCDVSLTYHSYSEKLVCHHCGFERKNYSECPECGSKYIRHFGTGTQKIEEEIKKEFPEATVIRMDADTTYKKFSHEKILKKFEKENINILLGTQMITKGLDFKNVTLAAVLAADGGLYGDDYRCYEETFSRITQVLGRAGRGDKEGIGIIQTYSPDNYVIKHATNHDYEEFYKTEIILRKQMKFPPFCDIIIFTGISENINEAQKIAEEVYLLLKRYRESKGIDSSELKFFPPAPAPVLKVKNKYRYRVFLKASPETDGVRLAGKIRNAVREKTGGSLTVDIL